VPELLQRLVQCAELTVLPAVEKQLRRASAPTLKRLLAPALPVGDQLRTVGRGSPWCRERHRRRGRCVGS